MRAEAAWALGQMRDDRAVDPLIDAFLMAACQHEDKQRGITHERKQIAKAMVSIGNIRGVEFLAEALKGTDRQVVLAMVKMLDSNGWHPADSVNPLLLANWAALHHAWDDLISLGAVAAAPLVGEIVWLEKEEKAQAAIGEIARRLRTNIQAHALIEELAAGLKKEWHGAVMEILVESKTDALAVFPLASLLKGMQNSSTGTVYQEVQKALKQILDRRVSSIAPDNLYIVAHLEDGRYEEMSNENPFEDGYIRYGRTVSHSYLREIAREELTRRGLKW